MSPTSDAPLLERAQWLAPALAPRLVAWQAQAGRHHLPWQQTRDPYRVWLSEVMLQQTQVSTVMSYYERFLQRFPTVGDLAQAPQDEVLALWSGLGYYSRARNLHRCAQAVVVDHGGRFPSTAAALQALPGIGPSTAAAIAAFCFSERVSILDGNVRRVLSRALAHGDDLSVAANERALWHAAQRLLPDGAKDMPAYTQGLMDLGATVCTPRAPACAACPWSDVCLARQKGLAEAYPVKSRKVKRGRREHWWLWLVHGDSIWLEQMPGTGVWADLWALPLWPSEASLCEWLEGVGVNGACSRLEPQPGLKHVLTHLDWHLHPRRLTLDSQEAARAADVLKSRAPSELLTRPRTGRWVPLQALGAIGLPAPVRKLLIS